MPTLLETWIAVIVIFVCGIMMGFEIRRLQDEKKASSISSPEFLEVNCGHEFRPIINIGSKKNPCVEESYRLHEEELKKRKEAFNCRMHNVPEYRTKKTVYIQCRNGIPVAMKEIYNGKGV